MKPIIYFFIHLYQRCLKIEFWGFCRHFLKIFFIALGIYSAGGNLLDGADYDPPHAGPCSAVQPLGRRIPQIDTLNDIKVDHKRVRYQYGYEQNSTVPQLFALHAKTGQFIWSMQYREPLEDLLFLGHNLFIRYTNSLLVVDSLSGEVKRIFPLPPFLYTETPALCT